MNEQTQTNSKIPWPVINTGNIGDNYGDGERIKVRCIHPQGVYYNFLRRRQDDVFDLIPQYVTVIDPKTDKPLLENGEVKKRLVTAAEQFSPLTMERVEPDTPVTITTAQEALNIEQDKLNESKLPRKK